MSGGGEIRTHETLAGPGFPNPCHRPLGDSSLASCILYQGAMIKSFIVRIIFLNSWFGQTGKPFFDFVKKESPKTDIFCFMEFNPELFEKTSKILKNHDGLIGEGMILDTFDINTYQTIFVKKGIKVLKSGKLLLYKNTSKDTNVALYVILKVDNKILNVLNVHGRSHPGTKLDTPVRIKQSNKIINFFSDKEGIRIIGGDFNLNPDTESIKMFEDASYRNLIKEFGIKNTRNELSWKQFQHEPGFKRQHFADYCFISPEIKVENFEVPYNEISDHLPLILDFNI